jgi:hypothetical protein
MNIPSGNRGHFDIFQILAWWISILWSKIKEPWLFFWLTSGVTSMRIGHGGRHEDDVDNNNNDSDPHGKDTHGHYQ